MNFKGKGVINIGAERQLSIHRSIQEISKEWDTLGDGSPYSKSGYLNLLEESGPVGYSYYYVLIWQQDVVVGGVYCQKKLIDLVKDYRLHTHSEAFLEKFKVAATKFVFSFVKHQMLICGNVLLTGEYGFSINNELESESDTLIDTALNEVIKYIKEEEGVKVNSVLLKDYYKAAPFKKTSFQHKDYFSFEVQPDMVIDINEKWESYDDYLAAAKSKYRVKFKKVKKSGKALEFRTLTLEEARLYNDDMYALYKATADRATFSLFLLQEHYFSKLLETFGDKLTLTGVFIEDKMVAFFTFLENGTFGDAHFLGYDVKLNSKHQIYFNILLKLVERSIEARVSHLNLSRTAIEIKSSVGAQPHEMLIHLKYGNKFINKRFPYFFKKFLPENKWVVRSPFKEDKSAR